MDLLFRASSFLTYWLDEVNEHSLHSPFLYDLYTSIIRQKTLPVPAIEDYRKKLVADESEIEYKDPGASKKVRKRKIRNIATSSLSNVKYSHLYYRLINYFNPAFVVELGTSLGINTLYLAETGKRVYTFEGAGPLAELSRKGFSLLKKDNIILIEGDINNTLPKFIQNHIKMPFIFFDANHTYDATINYFLLCVEKADHNSVFIFDDIHWSADMERAWAEIKNHPAVQTTVDLYRCGITFFDKRLSEQHLAVKF